MHVHTHYYRSLHVSGVLSDVLDFVLLHAKDTKIGSRGKVGEENGEAVKSKVFAECFRFLKALAKDNIQVQRRCVVMFLMHSYLTAVYM